MSSLHYFENIAQNWNHMREDYFDEALKEIVIPKTKIRGSVVADLGAGTGFLSLALADTAALVFAVDQSKNMLSELSLEARKRQMNHLFPIKGLFTDIPLFDDSMDYVFTNMALHHVEDPEKAIAEMYRILKPGGTLIISDVEAHTGTWAHEEMHDVWLGFHHAQIEQWIRAAGFKHQIIKSTGLSCKGTSSKGVFTQTGIFLAQGVK